MFPRVGVVVILCASLFFCCCCINDVSSLLFTTSQIIITSENVSDSTTENPYSSSSPSWTVYKKSSPMLGLTHRDFVIFLLVVTVSCVYAAAKGWKGCNPYNLFLTNLVLAEWQINLLRLLPTRYTSRVFGRISKCYVPVFARRPLFGLYTALYKCKMDEALVPDLTSYTTMTEFFTRKLKPGCRTVDIESSLVSPADCKVLSFGSTVCQSDNIQIEQVKGLTYPLKTFVGPDHGYLDELYSVDNDDKNIFYCTLYLGPDDYHWFHSPCQMNIDFRRHIPGDLFSVDPRLLRHVNGIFNFNERVLLSGRWEHGPFLYAAVGAYNVGSVKLEIPMDKDLETNQPIGSKESLYHDKAYQPIDLKPGDCMGRFEFGSTIVLVFTAPKTFQFTVQPGQKLNYGESIGTV